MTSSQTVLLLMAVIVPFPGAIVMLCGYFWRRGFRYGIQMECDHQARMDAIAPRFPNHKDLP